VALAGSLDVRTAPGVRKDLMARLSSTRVTSLEIDASGVERGDMSGMAVLYELTQGRSISGLRARLIGLRPELRKLLSAFPSEAVLERVEAGPPRTRIPEEVGAATVGVLRDVRDQISFIGGVVQAFRAATGRPRRMRWSDLAQVFEKAGVDALPIVSLVSLLTGLVIAFESAEPFARYGAQIFIADTIGRAMTRELGPIMTAVVLAGRSGSAFAAELGTMKVNEELNALETMGLDPIRFLVIQRVVAGTMLTPLLTAYSMATGVLGGAVVMATIGFSAAAIWTELAGAISVSDVLFGVFKGFVFGATVATIGCQRGMQTKQGASAVGHSATRAVVASIVLIIVIDSVFALLAYLLHV
jgi:phospholipid/cholesterol/gamma-HCH transport system permease protein